jgi:carbon storage regulator
MLVLSRKVGEKIRIGEDISIVVVRLSDGEVRLGIEAPSRVSVIRGEQLNKATDAAREAVLATTSAEH